MTATSTYDLEREIPDAGLLGYRDHDHSYWLNGKRLAACSTLLRVLDKPNLTRRGGWIEKQTAIGTVQALRLGELDGVPDEDLWERVRLLGLGCGKSDQAADRGTTAHDVVAGIANSGRMPNPRDVAEIARPWVQSAARAWQALNVVEVVEQEQIVCHPELGFAGRVDLLAWTRRSPIEDQVLTVVDYKTNEHGIVWLEACYQVALYALGVKRTLGLDVGRMVVAGLGIGGRGELLESPCTLEEAEALARLYRAGNRIKREMNAQRPVNRLEEAAA